MNWETVPPREATEAAGPTGWQPLSLAVSVQGAVNAAGGSQGWTVEMALPWSLLKQAAGRETPPKPGELSGELRQKEQLGGGSWGAWDCPTQQVLACAASAIMHVEDAAGGSQGCDC
jgi:hypothetical protein